MNDLDINVAHFRCMESSFLLSRCALQRFQNQRAMYVIMLVRRIAIRFLVVRNIRALAISTTMSRLSASPAPTIIENMAISNMFARQYFGALHQLPALCRAQFVVTSGRVSEWSSMGQFTNILNWAREHSIKAVSSDPNLGQIALRPQCECREVCGTVRMQCTTVRVIDAARTKWPHDARSAKTFRKANERE